MVLPRRGKGKQRSAVKAVFQRYDLMPARAVLFMRIFPRRLKRALVRFRARICEKRSPRPRALAQKLRQTSLRFAVIIVAYVLNAVQLIDHCVFPFFVVHAENVYRDPRAEVGIFFAVRPEKGCVLPADERDGQAGKGIYMIGLSMRRTTF